MLLLLFLFFSKTAVPEYLDEGSVPLVVEDLHPHHRAKLLKSVEERVRVGQVGRDVGHKQHNLGGEIKL